jgi:hypothetical protein
MAQSIKNNIATSEVVAVSTAQLKIKDIILLDVTNGVNREITEQKIQNLIQSLSFKDDVLRKAAIRTLNRFYKNLYFQVSSQIKKLSKNYQKEMEQTEPSYKVDLQNGFNPILEQQKFRPFIDNAPKGLAVIDNYRQQVKEVVKELATESPIVVRQRPDGTTYKVSLRNLAEIRVRYDANQQDLERFKDEDVDLVYSSSHADASVRCAPYQGKLYSISGKSGKTIDGIEYTPLDEALKGPDGDGNGIISGYNCRHRLIPYQRGLKPPTDYDERTIKKERSIDQKQRNYENRIRTFKQQERLLRDLGEKADAGLLRQRWQTLTDEYKRFSLNNGRAFYNWRLVLDPSELSNPDLLLSPNEGAPVEEALLVPNPNVDVEVKVDGLNNISIEKATIVKSILSNAPIKYKQLWNRYQNVLINSNLKSKVHPHFSPSENKINMPLDVEGNKYNGNNETLLHEYGHLIDYNATQDLLKIQGKDLPNIKKRLSFSSIFQSKKFLKTRLGQEGQVESGITLTEALREDFDNYVEQQKEILKADFEKVDKTDIPILYKGTPYEFKVWSKKIDKRTIYDSITRKLLAENIKISRAHDIFEGLTDGKIYGLSGHKSMDSKYWKKTGTLNIEAFAHMYSGKISNQESYESIKKYFPKSVELFEEMLDAINNNETITLKDFPSYLVL